MGKIICVVSGKGGVGKTTVAANVGLALAMLGKETLVIDADLGLRNLDLALGLQDSVMYDVLDVASGTCSTTDALITAERYPHFSFMPASQFKENNTVSIDEMRLVTELVKDRFDYILIDCPAGLGDIFSSAATVSDAAIVVVNPDPFSLRDGDRAADLLQKLGVEDCHLFLNRYKKELVQDGKVMNIMQVIEQMGLRIVGAVPDADEILLSAISGVPVVYACAEGVGKHYSDAAKRLCGIPVPLLEVEKKKGFLKKLFGRSR